MAPEQLLEGLLFRANQVSMSPQDIPNRTITTIDGDAGFGHYLGHIGMEHAIAMARDSGVGIVAVRNSNSETPDLA